MNEKLKIKAFYPHPPERVWKALTDPKALSRWLLPNDFKAQIGRAFRLGSRIQCEVTALEEGRSLTYSWREHGEDGEAGSASRVRWTLHPRDGGTEICLEHSPQGFEESYVLIQTQANWRFALGRSLPSLLRAMSVPPVPIVYMANKEQRENKGLERAGFRQEPVLAGGKQ